MFGIESVLAVAILMLVIGGVIGLVAGRAWIAPVQNKEMEQRLADTKRELDTYQQEVTQHFLATAQKVSDLTQSYRELHEHLAKGALSLTSTEVGRQLLAAGNSDETIENLIEKPIEPPRDWAPKMPGEQGMLSEEFGLRDEERDRDLVESTPQNTKQHVS